MARRRYYRSRRTVPRQKWLTNMCDVRIETGSDSTVIGSGVTVLFTADIITNESNQNGTTNGNAGLTSNATILKTGRWKCKGVITGIYATNYIIGMMYVPEGYNTNETSGIISQSVVYRHPEWVLAWKRVDYTDASQSNEFSLSSRLKRNLNSGDKVVFLLW